MSCPLKENFFVYNVGKTYILNTTFRYHYYLNFCMYTFYLKQKITKLRTDQFYQIFQLVWWFWENKSNIQQASLNSKFLHNYHALLVSEISKINIEKSDTVYRREHNHLSTKSHFWLRKTNQFRRPTSWIQTRRADTGRGPLFAGNFYANPLLIKYIWCGPDKISLLILPGHASGSDISFRTF